MALRSFLETTSPTSRDLNDVSWIGGEDKWLDNLPEAEEETAHANEILMMIIKSLIY